jgi:hypothetical protein
MGIEQYDGEEIRCPRIGGYVNFRFCRSENNFLPCRWVINCWSERMDIENIIKENYSPQELERIFTPPRPKMVSLLELVEKAKRDK